MTVTERRVLEALRRVPRGCRGPSIEALAHVCDRDTSTVKRAIRRLKKYGYIETWGGGGHGLTSYVRVHETPRD